MTRKDLSIAQQAVQSAHAAIDFCFQHPDRAGPWHKESNYLVILSVNNEKQIELLAESCKNKFLDYSLFREPDLNNEITAIAIEPSPITQKLVSRIPLAFKTEQNESISN